MIGFSVWVILEVEKARVEEKGLVLKRRFRNIKW